jgi:hypothetical protein
MLVECKPGTTFPGVIGRTVGESSPAWPAPLRAKEGAPNALFIVLDDTGFGQLSCYGSPINTPNINRLSKNVSFAAPLSVLAYTGINGELVLEPGPIEVSAGSGSSDIRQTANLDVTGKTRSIKGEERAFLSTATVGPAGI